MDARKRAHTATVLRMRDATHLTQLFGKPALFLQFFCNYWPCDQYMSTISPWAVSCRKSLFFQNLQCQIYATMGSHTGTQARLRAWRVCSILPSLDRRIPL